MMQPSAGSQPNSKKFLASYIGADKEKENNDLKNERIPQPGDYALRGQEDGLSIAGRSEYYV
jgi:hypothetical protein